MLCLLFFFQAEDGIRDLVRSRGLGDVYKRQVFIMGLMTESLGGYLTHLPAMSFRTGALSGHDWICLLYTSDAADDLLCVDLGGRRLIKKKKPTLHHAPSH